MQVGLAHLLPGATRLTGDETGINETYRGVVETVSDKRLAYVKLLPAKQLVNEVVCSVLGRSIGLSIPEGFLVAVLRNDYPDSLALQASGLDDALGFGVVSLPHPDLRRRIKMEGVAVVEQFIKTWSSWREAMTFDEWVANCDRNQGNLLVGAEGDVWLIDHSHAFTGPSWVAVDLQPGVSVPNQIADNIVPTLTLPQRHATWQLVQQLSAQFAAVDIENVLGLSRCDAFLGSADATALRDFLRLRTAELLRLIGQRLGLPVIV
jgi:hypothetical protein